MHIVISIDSYGCTGDNWVNILVIVKKGDYIINIIVVSSIVKSMTVWNIPEVEHGSCLLYSICGNIEFIFKGFL